jgi:serine/threonine protein kinase
VACIGMQVADALAHAASQGVLHRDIKPSNLLLDDTGNVWVADFGLAKADSDPDNLTHSGDVVGTLRYMAPERFSGQGDVRSDVYSLGLTLYELLALRPAFDETDRSRLVRQVMHDEPLRPRKLNPRVPRDLETLVLKAIARDPAHRYQTPAEMADDLKCFRREPLLHHEARQEPHLCGAIGPRPNGIETNVRRLCGQVGYVVLPSSWSARAIAWPFRYRSHAAAFLRHALAGRRR